MPPITPNDKPEYLEHLELEAEFDELTTQDFLDSTCKKEPISVPEVTSYGPKRSHGRWNRWRGVKYLRFTDNACLAEVWRRRSIYGPDGERAVQYFTSRDGKSYALKPGVVIRPSTGPRV